MNEATVNQLLALMTLLVGSGGFVGAVYALLKLRPEAGQITVDAAHKVVQFQAEVIERIEAENKELRRQVTDLLARVRELERRAT